MDVGKFIKFILCAKEQERKEQIRKQWTTMLPYMSLQMLQYIPFEQYYEKCTGANIDMRSTDEIIAEIEETHRRAKEVSVDGSV